MKFEEFVLQRNYHDYIPRDSASGLDLFLYLKERTTDLRLELNYFCYLALVKGLIKGLTFR